MSAITLTADQVEHIRAGLTRLNLWSKKETVIKEFSFEDKTHISELSTTEAEHLLVYLKDLDERCQKMRRKMLSLGYEMFFDEPRTPAQSAMDKSRVNWTNVNAWCTGDKCRHKKLLNKLDPFELAEVLQQFEQVREGFKKTKAKRNGN